MDVEQAGGNAHSVRNGEGESVRLSGVVIRVLPDDHDFDLVKGRQEKGVKNIVHVWIDDLTTIMFVFQKLLKCGHIRLAKFISDV